MIKELITFASEFQDDEDEPNLLQKIKQASQQYMMTEHQIEALQEEIRRVVKMFYLQMKVKNNLKPLRDDYFV